MADEPGRPLPGFGRHFPAVVKQYYLEAQSLHANSVRELKLNKRYALAVVMIHTQRQKALDAIADIFIKKIQNLLNTAELRLQQYHLEQVKRTEKLIGRFRAVLDVPVSAGVSGHHGLDAIHAALKSDPSQLRRNAKSTWHMQ